ncbi:hypothetical protein GCM10027447_20730 [Glycomyces halotolerans]
MSEFTSPVPVPGPDAVAPEVYREFYGMPMFVSLPTDDFAASMDFWIRGFGFIDLFSIPEQVAHLRRWAFQDVLLVPGERSDEVPAMSVSFACVANEIDRIAARCEELVPGCTTGPAETPWNTVDVAVITPERTRVVMTAGLRLDPRSEKAARMREMGLDFIDG